LKAIIDLSDLSPLHHMGSNHWHTSHV
jgi:hypothetical protein